MVVARTRMNSIFSLFAGAVGWPASLLLSSSLGRWLDCRPGHWQSGIDGRRSCSWLLRVILVEGVDQLFLGAERLTMVPKYFLPWGSLSTLPDSKGLVDGLTPTRWHRRRCPELPLPRTPRYPRRRRLIPVLLRSPAPSWWCPAPAVTRGTHCELSTSLVVRACRPVCLLGAILETVQRTWLLASGFVWS